MTSNKYLGKLAALTIKIELIGKLSWQMQCFCCHSSKYLLIAYCFNKSFNGYFDKSRK